MKRKVKLSERAVADMKKALRRHGCNVDTKPLKVVVSTFKRLNKPFNKQFNQ